MPKKPSSPHFLKISLGKMPARSHSSACGASSFSAKVRTVRRNASCSCVNGFSIAPPVCALLPRQLARRPIGGKRQAQILDLPRRKSRLAQNLAAVLAELGRGRKANRPEVEGRSQLSFDED